MKIQGRKCTLTVLKDNEFIPLPYSEETVRLTSKGYTLPSCIGRRNRLKRIETGKLIQGCFVTRLEYLCTKAMFLLLFYNESSFDLYADQGFEKVIYKQVLIKGFELRGDNGEAFKLRSDLTGDNAWTESWPVVTPSLDWERRRTYFFDGHAVTADLNTLPLIYRFELTGEYAETSSYKIKIYFPLSDEHYPAKSKIEKLTLVLDLRDGISLDLYDLEPEGEMVDINCADTVLCNQSFRITGPLVFNVRNEKEMLQIVL